MPEEKNITRETLQIEIDNIVNKAINANVKYLDIIAVLQAIQVALIITMIDGVQKKRLI